MRKTSLYQFHIDNDARLVPFAGYEMPLHYESGIVKEHLWVRSHCGLFDVSHMGQIFVRGSRVSELFSYITPTNFKDINDFSCKYTVLTDENSCVIDDLIISQIASDLFYLVVNASRKDIDLEWISKFAKEFDCNVEPLDNYSLIAIQGCKSFDILSDLFNRDLSDLKYMNIKYINYKGVDLLVSRTGYTGEDGFEISIPDNMVNEFCSSLLSFKEIKPVGLGARDSLRLEMGYPLYGHELSQDINLAESSLSWIISRDNKFLGYDNLKNISNRKRVSFKLIDKGIARDNMEIYDSKKNLIGYVTSAGYSPSLSCSIGQAYININNSNINNEIFIKIRGNFKKAIITKLMLFNPKLKKAS